VTNSFIVGRHREATVQQQWLDGKRQSLNVLRARRGLPAIHAAAEFYRADLQLLADPPEVADRCELLGGNAIVTGHCAWEFKDKQEEDVPEAAGAIVFSMGSTGKWMPSAETVARLKSAINARMCIYVGPRAVEAAEITGIDRSFKFAPLRPLVHRAALVVTQGGTGSSYHALSLGIPLGILSTHQNHVVLGSILEELGVAVCLDRPGWAGVLKSGLDSMHAKAQAMAARMKKAQAAELIARSCLGRLV
jgi:UDP:flavonoid glycosyltransferase YjiC (YdhE family)